VREIVGVDAALCRRWSLRRVSIVARRDELAAEFRQAHGRAPTTVEEMALAQRANLETRQPKHEARSEAEQRATWRREAAAVLGSETVIATMVRTALNAPRHALAQVAPGSVRAVAAVVVRELEESRAVWEEAHIRAEILRQIRGVALPADQVEEVVERVRVTIAPLLVNLTPERDPVAEPEGLPGMRRSDGTSVYRHTGSDHFTSPRILEAEARLVAAAGAVSDFGFTAEEIEVTLAACAVAGERLNLGQADLVRAMAGGGEWLRLGLAPAGSGKTTAMRALARVWTDHGYGVVGLAPSAAAAAALREATGMFTETLAKLDYELSTHDTAAADLEGLLERVRPGTLVVIDEAGMASTLVLDRMVGYCLARGAVVRLIGDDQQLAAVGAGGVLRDIAATHGADRMEEVVRFADPVEAQASLDLREGDPAALGFYIDHDRIHAGEETACLDAVFEAWVESRAAGEDCLMLAPTRELVGELNERARAARLAALPAGHRHAVEVVLADGTRASVGDTVITRRNERRLAISGTDWVKNGDRWIVAGVSEAGMHVRHASSGLSTVLPPEYVAADVELGYASTVHTAQGVTADVMHGIVTGEESRQLVYTMLTRGRAANHAHVVIEHPAEAAAYGAADQMLPGLAEQLDRAKAVDVLTGILGRDGSAVSATTTRIRGASAGTRLH
ncbi:MAG: AAA family ATPase, partial [Pseudonocardiaceae bacterium]